MTPQAIYLEWAFPSPGCQEKNKNEFGLRIPTIYEQGDSTEYTYTYHLQCYFVMAYRATDRVARLFT
jgi:hypothetical protein